MKLTHLFRSLLLLAGSLCALHAGGTLTPKGATQQPIQIRDHQVNVTINNGFAQTEVLQTFFNPNPADLEAIYAFPVPQGASLSEVTLVTGEKTLQGEVLPKAEAQTVYEEEKSSGNDAGLATKNDHQTFEFRVAPVRANAEVRLRFVYFQPLTIDTGIGRYLYPLEAGRTDEAAQGFWGTNTQVEGTFAVNVELKSAWPVTDVRVPGFEGIAAVQKFADGHYRLSLNRAGAKLDRDFVFYYRLADNLPGRVEIIPYRAHADQPGTFMMLVTPGLDLQPLAHGADYVYVLDVSGSMKDKLATLAKGLSQALGQMHPADRFRVVAFNHSAREVIDWTAATPENVQTAIARIQALSAGGKTNLYEGIKLGLQKLDDDRATSLVLVTDGVANEGLVNPAAFHQLLKQYDLRVFGFLMGNSANWPLLRTITEATGGFYAAVSNADDIVGQLILAKSKIGYEALHDASFAFSGVRVFDTTGDLPGKIYRGQQLVIFGRYDQAGPATVALTARMTGADRTYTTQFDFPATATDNPEIERLWAMARIEQFGQKENVGALTADAAKAAIQALGVDYQIVTDHTAMVVLDDDTYAHRGLARHNQQRTATEHQAQSARAQAPAKSHQVDAARPTYTVPVPHLGGGAIDPLTLTAMVLVLLAAASLYARRHLCPRAAKTAPTHHDRN